MSLSTNKTVAPRLRHKRQSPQSHFVEKLKAKTSKRTELNMVADLRQSEETEAQKAECQKEVDDAVENLRGTRPKNIVDLLLKVRELVATDQSAETVETIKRDISAFLEPEPIIDLCQRWARVKHWEDQLLRNDPTGNAGTPSLDEAADALNRLERDIENTVPRSPEGLAALMEYYWATEGNTWQAGTEQWEKALKSRDLKVLSHVRDSAAHVAGLCDARVNRIDLRVLE